MTPVLIQRYPGKRTQQRMCGCASREVLRPWDSGQGRLCDLTGSCAWSSCCCHIRSIQVDVASVYSIQPVIPIASPMQKLLVGGVLFIPKGAAW